MAPKAAGIGCWLETDVCRFRGRRKLKGLIEELEEDEEADAAEEVSVLCD